MICQRCSNPKRKNLGLYLVHAPVPFRIVYCNQCRAIVSKSYKVEPISLPQDPAPKSVPGLTQVVKSKDRLKK